VGSIPTRFRQSPLLPCKGLQDFLGNARKEVRQSRIRSQSLAAAMGTNGAQPTPWNHPRLCAPSPTNL
jgi:hypothetical protein